MCVCECVSVSVCVCVCVCVCVFICLLAWSLKISATRRELSRDAPAKTNVAAATRTHILQITQSTVY